MLPTSEQIRSLIQTGDVFKYAVVGFSAIETALEELIMEGLVTTHRPELHRLSAELKIDLSVGLGLFRADSKPLLMKLSRIRNFYAHEFAAGAEYCSADELKSSFSTKQRSMAGAQYTTTATFQDALRIAFVCAYYEVADAVERVQRKKREHAEIRLEAAALIAAIDATPSSAPREDVLRESKKLDALIEEKKKEILSKRSQAEKART